MTLSLTSPEAVVAAAPHLLGFHPRDSVVVIWLTDRQIALTQRVDTADAVSHPDVLTDVSANHLFNEAIMLCYDGSPDLYAPVIHAMAATDCTIRDVLHVTEHGTYWVSLLHAGTDDDGPNRHHVTDATRARAADLFAGLGAPAPVSSRESLALTARLNPRWRTHLSAVRRALPAGDPAARDTARDLLITETLTAITTPLPAEPAAGPANPTGPDRDACLAFFLRDIRVRDALVWHLTRLNSDTLTVAYDTFVRAALCVPADHAAPAATCAGLAAYLGGDGARANIAVGYALASEPDYSLARMLATSLTAALSPQTYRDAMAGLTYDSCRYGTAAPTTAHP